MARESPFRLLGIPLVHIASGRVENGQYHRGVARGWIAVGDIAFVAVGGAALAWWAAGGGLAVARDFAIGGVAAAHRANDAAAQSPSRAASLLSGQQEGARAFALAGAPGPASGRHDPAAAGARSAGACRERPCHLTTACC